MTQKVPVIILDRNRSSWSAASFFNPNDWPGPSKGIVMSCWTELGLLFYCRDRIVEACGKGRSLEMCAVHIAEMQNQWKKARFPFEKMEYFAEVPDFHIQIEGFFAASKALLDLLMQLVSSERIVSGRIHGFHDKGERILNMLQRNVIKGEEQIASSLTTLIRESKSSWIDQLIDVRDILIHPGQGQGQIMFRLSFQQDGEEIKCIAVIPPAIKDLSIDRVAIDTVEHLSNFSQEFIGRIHPKNQQPV